MASPPGPFVHLNAEKIGDELLTMWRTMYKLTKTLSDLPGPRRIADSFKMKIDKFKQHLPVLTTICNPGINDRHWEKVSTTTPLPGSEGPTQPGETLSFTEVE